MEAADLIVTPDHSLIVPSETATHLWLRQPDGRHHLLVRFTEGEKYNLFGDYHRLRQGSRQRLAAVALQMPHGSFFQLGNRAADEGRYRLALQWMEKYGAIGVEPLLSCGWIDLEEFWAKQRRFVLVTTPWLLRDEPDGGRQLRNACKRLIHELSVINAADEWPIFSADTEEMPLHVRQLSYMLSREQAPVYRDWHPMVGTTGERWLSHLVDRLTHEEIRLFAALLLWGELNAQAKAESQPYWWLGEVEGQLSYDLTLEGGSLWRHLWVLFGWDTGRRAGIRLCPPDLHPSNGHLFYPDRRDQLRCNSREQKQLSATRWWKENKEAELQKRREARARQKRRRLGKRSG